MKYKDFTEFNVWQRGFKLLLKVYEVTKKFPAEERFGITSDIRRAANSITHNIAEGFGREGTKDKCNFYKTSRGSAYEIISQTLVSRALSYLQEKDNDEIITECKSIIEELNSMIKFLKNNSNRNP